MNTWRLRLFGRLVAELEIETEPLQLIIEDDEPEQLHWGPDE